jgi:hypothetical protein
MTTFSPVLSVVDFFFFCAEQVQNHFRALVPAVSVPDLVKSCCKCTADCRCMPGKQTYIYNLSSGLGPSHLRFERQRKALQDEIDKYHEELAELPFHTKTVEPPKPYPHGPPIETVLKPSSLGQNQDGPVLLGVFPKSPQPAITKSTPTMSRSVHSQLSVNDCLPRVVPESHVAICEATSTSENLRSLTHLAIFL